MTRVIGRGIAAVLTAVLAALLSGVLAQPAWAHNVLVSSSPEKGAQLDQAPSEITLTFNATVQQGPGNQIVVTGPDGKQYVDPNAQVAINGPEVSVPLSGLGPAGEYTIGYRILSADGHVVQNKLSFTLTKDDPANAGRPGAGDEAQSSGAADTQAEEPDEGLPLWVWIGGAIVLVAVGLVVALRLGRSES
ncbi:MAG: copper resistance protein CopC [Thermocrispum agreste]|uniref:Copper resistance protein CopC n=1 Tax=Thermocrispum agreste TaxID=37925 RepID=A0A2W4IWK1_9PSEU|nr:MAG: copper resistance protein CopC [Thermocrispum agreste]